MKKLLVFILCFGIAFGIIAHYVLGVLSEEETVLRVKSIDGQIVHNVENKDYVGWLTIPDTNIDYPVMHTPEEQNYYLNRDINKNHSSQGSLFMAAYSELDGPNMLIYGHNMQNGTMFRDVTKYQSEDFYNAHRRIIFDVGGEIREYEVFAVCKSKIHERAYRGFKYYDYDGIYNEEMYDYYVSNVKSLSMYETDITPEYGEQLITLSTCSHHTKDGRMFIVGVEREPTPEITQYLETYKEPSDFSKVCDILLSLISGWAQKIKFFVMGIVR